MQGGHCRAGASPAGNIIGITKRIFRCTDGKGVSIFLNITVNPMGTPGKVMDHPRCLSSKNKMKPEVFFYDSSNLTDCTDTASKIFPWNNSAADKEYCGVIFFNKKL